MKLTIESTNVTTSIDGVRVRLWEGVTESGVRCKVFAHRVVIDESDRAEFSKDLSEQLPPAELVIPLADVLDY